jgi:hypothetical protein
MPGLRDGLLPSIWVPKKGRLYLNAIPITIEFRTTSISY